MRRQMSVKATSYRPMKTAMGTDRIAAGQRAQLATIMVR